MKKGLAVFSGSTAVHKLLQDGQVVLGHPDRAASVTVSGTLVVQSTLTVDAADLVVGSDQAYAPETNLSGILAAIKADVDAAASQGSTDLGNLSSSLKTYIDGIDSAQTTANGNLSSSLKTYIDGLDSAQTTANGNLSSSFDSRINTLSGAVAGEVVRLDGRLDTLIGSGSIASTLDTIKEIADFLDGDGAAAADLTERVRTVSASLDSYKTANDTAVSDVAATASANLAAANFKVNGQAISASGGEFRFVGDSNITIGDLAAGTGSVSLNSNVSISGKFSGSSVEASGEVKGATVVSTGKMTAGNALEVTAGGLQIVAGGAQITGSVALKDGLNVSGSTTLQGAATLQSSLTVAGVAQLNGALTASAGARISALSVDNAASVGGNLSVTGTSTLTGKLTANGGIDINGNLSGSGTLDIGGAATVAGALSVGGNAAITGSLTVSQAATFNNGVSVATGSAAVEHGTLKAVMVSGVDDLATLWSAAASSNGKFFYLQGAAAGGFPRGDCWYFCQNSDWFDAPFFGPEV